MDQVSLPNTPKTFKSKFIDHLNSKPITKNIPKCYSVPSKTKTGYSPFKSDTNEGILMKKRSKDSDKQPKFRVIEAQRNHQGHIHGYAHLQYEDQSHFIGTYRNGARKCGIIRYASGVEIKGQFKNNQLHGDCEIFLNSGSVIKIGWEDGKPLEKGKIIYDNGQIYEGEITNFKKHGKGTLILGQGKKYVGDFSNGRIHGNGVLFENEEIRAIGTWLNGELVQ